MTRVGSTRGCGRVSRSWPWHWASAFFLLVPVRFLAARRRSGEYFLGISERERLPSLAHVNRLIGAALISLVALSACLYQPSRPADPQVKPPPVQLP